MTAMMSTRARTPTRNYYQNSPFTPTMWPNCEIFFLDVLTSANGVVSQWDDLSGNARHLVQSTAANRPIHGDVGSNLFTAPTGTNWTDNGNGTFTHTAGATTGLNQTVLTAGNNYLITIVVATRTAGSITPNAGGTAGTAVSANGTTSQVLNCITNGIASIAPTSDFDGTITINYKLITTGPYLYFDGIQRYMATGAFTFNQPCTIYLVVNQITWTNQEYIFDGNTVNKNVLYQNATSPRLSIYAGSALSFISPTVGINSVITIIFNSTSSAIRLNLDTAVTGNAGTNNMDGMNLGRRADGANYSNILVKAAIGYSGADGDSQQEILILYGSQYI